MRSNDQSKPVFFPIIENAPQAIGPYSVATLVGSTLYCSGQIAIDPATGKMISEDFEAQTSQVLKNISAILNHLKISTSDILKSTVFMTDLSNFPKFNALYGAWLGDAKPARSTIGVAALPAGAIIEVEIIANLPGN